MLITSKGGRRPVARERVSKALPVLLLLVPVGIAVSLWTQDPPTADKRAISSDVVSLQILRLWSKAQPDDMDLKLRLVRALLAANLYEEAARELDSISTSDPQQRLQAKLLRMQLHLLQLAQDPGRAARDPELQHQLMQELEELLAEPLSVEQLILLAAQSLRSGHPELAVRIYQRLAVTDPQKRSQWLAAAAEQALASGQPATAGSIFEQLADSETDPQKRQQYALRALDAFVRAAQPDKAFALARRYAQTIPGDRALLEMAAKMALANNQPAEASRYFGELMRITEDALEKRRYAKLVLTGLTAADQTEEALVAATRFIDQFPGNLELLNLAVKLARGNNRPRLAQLWGRALLARHPNSAALIAQQIGIELAAGDIAAALALARRLVELQPGSIAAHERLAQISLWAGQPQTALEQWAYLALRLKYFKHLDPAIAMAPQLNDLETLAKLLALKARHGRLSNTQLIALVDTFEAIGEPEQLVGILSGYVERYADHREAWFALADEQERRGDLRAALALLERINHDFGSNVGALMRQASLFCQLREPRQAYVLLRDVLDRAGVASTRDLLNRAELGAKHAKEPPRLAMPPAQRQSFLKLLAEVFWYSEPEPEALDDYRKLWRAGALLREAASRYIQLASASGLNEEAAEVAEAAYERFGTAEFLLTAMDFAYRAERWTELGRLIKLADKHGEEFAEDKNFYLILAEYYTHLGDYDRARRAYFKIIAIDPSNVSARADVLWLLIEHSDRIDRQKDRRNRRELFRILTGWRGLAANEPSLWLPLATGWAMLGKSKEAVSWYKREWTRRPDDHLWLLGYASNLDAVSRSSDARRLRRYALTVLRPEALRAAHPGVNEGEREVLKAYTELVREVYGVGKGSRWLSELWRSDLDSEVRRDLFATWRDDGESGEPSSFIRDIRTVSRQNPWGRFAKAPKRAQEQLLATIADAPADVGIPSEGEVEPPPAPLLVLEPDATAGEDKSPTNSKNIGLEADAQNIDELIILSTKVSVLLARGAWAMGGHLGVNHLLFNGVDDSPPSLTEIDLAAFGMWRHRRGRLEVGAGANLRSDSNLFSGWVKENIDLWQGGTLNLGVHINEATTDSPFLRLYGARHRVDVGLHTSFLTDGILNVEGSFYQFHTRTNEDLGTGFNTEADIGYRIHRVRPLWTVRVSAAYARNFATPIADLSVGSDLVSTLRTDLPQEFASFGVGTHFEHRFPGIAPIGAGRWRYLGEAWVGWLWPLNIVGFEARAGVGLALPNKQEISLTGFIANNRWLGPGVLNAGLGLRYSFR